MVDTTNFDQLRLGLASPEEIRKWSKGEVRKPETINYRTFKPEPDGLFCERIFGPTRDWECHCGKYRKIKFRGITCDRCGVEVTRAKVRRERMGHVELAAPVSHIWYLRGVPSPMSLLLDISPRPLEKVIYFASYIVTQVDEQRLQETAAQIVQAVEEEKRELDKHKEDAITQIEKQEDKQLAEDAELSDQQKDAIRKASEDRVRSEEKQTEERKQELDQAAKLLLGTKLDGKAGLTRKQLITEVEYRGLQRLMEVLSERRDKRLQNLFSAALGAEGVRELLHEIDLDELSRSLHHEITQTTGPKRARAVKRLEVVEAFRKSKNRPEWMVMSVVPVIPPELRPMVQLDGGRFATSDLNDLYRRIINRNNRLKKIVDLRAPESIINHEKRLLQEAVDALIDNGRRTRPVTGSNNRPLKSLSDMLKGKEGRFRKNLLGKRVDYSGRSVIVVGPHLKLHQCGLPKEMALELFKPFVMKRLVERGHTTNVKTAKKMVDRVRPEVWDALEEVIKDHPILLNRAPTLHRLGVQAFEPVLVDGKAIQIHPLVCSAFNADFDGDQMAVHVPLSAAAQAEARVLMLSIENLFSPAHGKPTVTPNRDMVLGTFYLTQKREAPTGSGGKGVKEFSNAADAILAWEHEIVDLHAAIRVREQGQLLETTVGRLIFNEVLPPRLRHLDRPVDEKELSKIVSDCHTQYGNARTVQLLDDLKDLGFRFATSAGITIAMTDMDIPQAPRAQIIHQTEEEVAKINQQYLQGLISAGEREQQVCASWERASKDVMDAILREIDPFNPIFMMVESGARGTRRQISQLAGMRGLMTDPFGRFIEDLPIKSNFHEGLSVLEYFVSTHGARKGLADTALRTADAGYLTRRLVDVAQDVIIRAHDCETTNGITVAAIRAAQEEIESLEQRVDGRVTMTDLLDPRTGRRLLAAGREIGYRTDACCPNCNEELVRTEACSACGFEREPTEGDELALEPPEPEMVGEIGLSTRAANVLQAAGIKTLDDLLDRTDTQLMAIDGFGPSALEEVQQALTDRELSLAQAKAEGEEAEEEQQEVPAFDPTLCPECGQQTIEPRRVCSGCQTEYQPQEVESSLAAIRRVIFECDHFQRQSRAAKAGAIPGEAIHDPFTGAALAEAQQPLSEVQVVKIHEAARQLHDRGGLAKGEITIRSPLSCDLKQGICAKCYGRDLASGRLVEIGEAVGIIAAQSIGEPGTQLTMRTFHTGGVAAQYLTGVAEVKKKRQETLKELHEDIRRGLVTLEEEGGGQEREGERKKKIQQMLKVLEEQVKGLLRVVELVEARRPKGQAIVCDVDGVVAAIDTRGVKTVVVHSEQSLDREEERLVGELAAETVADPATGEVLIEEGREIRPEALSAFKKHKIRTVKIRKSYMVPYRGYLSVTEGQELQQGDSLTEGPLDPQRVLSLRGLSGAREYLVREVQAVYKSQGVDINDKHIEVIVRQMLRKRKVLDPGDTDLLPGQVVDRFDFDDANSQIAERGGRVATAEPVLLGITEASLATDSFLSAASFQKTTRVLTDAAIKGKTDGLIGLKENVIIGRLIPAGTGFSDYRRTKVVGPPTERPLFLPELPEGAAPELAERMRMMEPAAQLLEPLGEAAEAQDSDQAARAVRDALRRAASEQPGGDDDRKI